MMEDEIGRVGKARAEICKSENDKKELDLEDCRKGLTITETARLKKLAECKTAEIKSGVASAVEPEIMHLFTSDKTKLEQAHKKYIVELSNFKTKIRRDSERELSATADMIEKDIDSKCQELAGQQRGLLAEMRLQCECDYKITRENHVRDMDEDRRQFYESRESRMSDNLADLAQVRNSEECLSSEKLSKHEGNMRYMKEEHESMIQSEKSGRNEYVLWLFVISLIF